MGWIFIKITPLPQGRKQLDGTCANNPLAGCRDLATAKYRPNPYNAKANVWGTYLLSHLKLAEQWTLSPALRFDHYKTSEVSSQSYQKAMYRQH